LWPQDILGDIDKPKDADKKDPKKVHSFFSCHFGCRSL